MQIHIVFLSGGAGSRLWPVSRTKHPKQFLDIQKNGNTMFQNTLSRLKDINISRYTIVCNEDHRFFIANQFSEINIPNKIIIEPEGRNTAPAIALASLFAENDEVMLVLPVDHLIFDVTSFTKIINDSVKLAQDKNLITFGIKTTSAHTGYGYIKKGKKFSNGYRVDEFKEKPSIELASKYHESDKFLWNSGMFMFKPSVYLNELKKSQPQIYDACCKASNNYDDKSDFIDIDKDEFRKCPADSIDYAVMENTNDAIVIPMDVGWNDIGSWNSLWEVSKKDDNLNVINGNVIVEQTTSSFIDSNNILVATLGVSDLIISVTDDAILVANKNKSDEVKKITDKLASKKMEQQHYHRKVYRPWGNYDSVDFGEGFQVKRITVDPKQKLSVQMHHHRSEHWVVVSGKAIVHYGEEKHELNVNESTYHDKEVVHALENPSDKPLVLIEVQIGSYLGEDDIVRYDDIYGRVDK